MTSPYDTHLGGGPWYLVYTGQDHVVEAASARDHQHHLLTPEDVNRLLKEALKNRAELRERLRAMRTMTTEDLLSRCR